MSVSFVFRGVFGIVTDLTVGKPGSVLFRFTFPLLLSVVFQQFYNIVDSIIAGHYIGVNALAAVGASAPITMLFLAIANGMNIGCSVVISQYFGGKHMTHMKSAVSTAVIVAGVRFLKIVSPFYFLIPVKLVVDGILRGAGSMASFMVSTFSDLLLRVGFAYILAPYFAETGIWYSWPIGWTVASILSFSFYAAGVWKKRIPKEEIQNA